MEWRRDDEELYQRLRDRGRTALLFQSLNSQPTNRVGERAEGLSALLRADSIGQEAFERAEAGDVEALGVLVHLPRYHGRRPTLLHHLALLHSRVAKETSGEVSVKHTLHALAAWAALRAEGVYLRDIAFTVAPELDDAARQGALHQAATEPLDAVRAAALEDAGERGPGAYRALRLHARRGEFRTLLGVEAPDIELSLAVLGSEVSEAAMEPIERALDDAATSAIGTLQVDLLARLSSLGSWAGGSRDVDHRFLERALPIAWTVYKGSDKTLLARFVATTKECVDRCAARVLADPSEIAQASRVAQMLVFRAESVRTLTGQVEAIEKALEVCPTHRNGRLVAADIIAFRGLERLRGAAPIGRQAAADAALADAIRARALWPRCKRLARLVEELARVGRMLPKEDGPSAGEGS